MSNGIGFWSCICQVLGILRQDLIAQVVGTVDFEFAIIKMPFCRRYF
jgi:hypothetical protein